MSDFPKAARPRIYDKPDQTRAPTEYYEPGQAVFDVNAATALSSYQWQRCDDSHVSFLKDRRTIPEWSCMVFLESPSRAGSVLATQAKLI